jgi:CRP-like cAMP-binding protein
VRCERCVLLRFRLKRVDVNQCTKGMGFGELALMYDAPRAATVQAVSDDVVTWAIDRTTFKQVMIGTTQRRVGLCTYHYSSLSFHPSLPLCVLFPQREMYEDFLEGVPILAALSKEEKLTVADALQSVRGLCARVRFKVIDSTVLGMCPLSAYAGIVRSGFRNRSRRRSGRGPVLHRGRGVKLPFVNQGSRSRVLQESFFGGQGELKGTKAGVEEEVCPRLTRGAYFGEIALIVDQVHPHHPIVGYRLMFPQW